MKISRKKWIKRLLVFCIGTGCAGIVCGLAGNAYVKRYGGKRIVTEEEAISWQTDADCIMVLGCGIRKDGEPTRMLKDRLDKGIALYQAGAAPKLLMSGDHGQADYDEVNKMKEYAIDCGVPSGDVFMDHAGFSTYESMYRARDVFQVESMIVVTQEYHLYRAIYIAEHMGINTIGVPSAKIRYGGQRMRDLREIMARNKDIAACLLKPEPTYLGEAIPVWGDGNATNDQGNGSAS